MELTLSTHLLVYGELEDASLQAVAAAGYRRLEAWLAEPHLPWRREQGPEGLRRRFGDHGLEAGTVHLPFYPSVPELVDQGRRWSVIDPDPELRRQSLEGAERGLQAAAALGAPGAGLPHGWEGARGAGAPGADARPGRGPRGACRPPRPAAPAAPCSTSAGRATAGTATPAPTPAKP